MNSNEQANKFLQWVNNNYEYLKQHHQAYCLNTRQNWDEDIFCDTYLKIYEKIRKDGIKDDSDRGFECYFFMAFKMNTKRETQYSRNTKKDENNANLPILQEIYLNTQLTEREKLLQDLQKDYFTLRILEKIEKHFPPEDCRLFKIKLFESLTYKQLAEKTCVKGIRQKIVDIKNWIKENITKEELIKEFNEKFGDLIFE